MLFLFIYFPFLFFFFFFFNDTATTEIYTLSLHDALPISFTPFLNVNALSGPANPFPGAKLISHCDPAYSQFDVMMSTPIWGICSRMRPTVGTYAFRIVLKMWYPLNSGSRVSGFNR